MRRRLAMLTGAVALGPAILIGAGAAAGTGSPAAGRAAAPSAAWGTALEVPGSQPLNKGGQAVIGSLSCPATTACSAGGSYTAGINGHIPVVQAFVVNKTRGIWRRAVTVPGIAALNTAGRARVTAVSCAAPGDCGAGGFYGDAFDHQQAFVVDEINGTWGTAREVPGTAALDKGNPGAAILSVSCAAAGNCSAGGAYTNSTPATQAFVVTETNGTWGTAKQVRGIAILNKRKLAQVSSVSCAEPGNCSAGGFYADAAFHNQAFVVDETNGTWGIAQEIPGTAALDQGSPGAMVVSLSCAAAGECSAGGVYADASDLQQAFVADESGGTWGAAQEVPGTAALNAGGLAATQAVSCAPAGGCSAGGGYTNANKNTQVFVASQTGS